MIKHYCYDNKKIPENTTHLEFGFSFNFNIDYLSSYSLITHLKLGNGFNKLVDNLPNSITHLTFGNNFNQPIDNLPNSITQLTFVKLSNFNQLVNNLPNSITHLTFGNSFNQSVNNLPNSITYLTFGLTFNQLVDNLPNSITHLTFGNNFNQSVNNLPNSVIYLTLEKSFNKSIDNIVNFLKILKCNEKIYNTNKEKLKNKFIKYYDCYNDYVYYKYKDFTLTKPIIYDVVLENILELQYFVYEILFKNLIKYVLNPQRLLRMAEKHNISIEEYLEFL